MVSSESLLPILVKLFFFPSVLHRKPRPEFHCSIPIVPPGNSSLHPGSSMGMVQAYFNESGVLWMC